jgi:hypothetical protein
MRRSTFLAEGQNMTIHELIRSIHDLENYLKKFEEKYGLLSDDFYRLATTGKLEQSNDFIEWLGIFEIKLKRERKYQQWLSERLAEQTGFGDCGF